MEHEGQDYIQLSCLSCVQGTFKISSLGCSQVNAKTSMLSFLVFCVTRTVQKEQVRQFSQEGLLVMHLFFALMCAWQ